MSEIMVPFDGGLGMSDFQILIEIYRCEHDSIDDKESYESYLKNEYPNEYSDFLKYKEKIEKRTPNIKKLVFDWFDGKTPIPDFDLFKI